MPGSPYAALTPAAGVLAHGWPIEVVVTGCATTRGASASRALGNAVAALIESGEVGELAVPAGRAIVVGTESAAIGETARFAREIAEVGASLVNPALFPLTVMNAASGLAAIRHQCEGPNVTLSNGPGSALDALVYAADLVVEGRAALVFAGGFEVLAEAGADVKVLAVVCAVMARDRAIAAHARERASLVATAATVAGVPRAAVDDLASHLASAAMAAACAASSRHDPSEGRRIVVETSAGALAALAEAAGAPASTTIVARRKGSSGGTALILGPPAGRVVPARS